MDYWSGDSGQSDVWIVLTAVEACSSAISALQLCECKGKLILKQADPSKDPSKCCYANRSHFRCILNALGGCQKNDVERAEGALKSSRRAQTFLTGG